MRKKIIIITTSLIILLMLSLYFSNISNAAIEVKAGTAPHLNVNVNTAYQYCYDMRSSTSTLGNNTLDPHLTLNADWAAVTYLGASAYGNVRDRDGASVTINGTTYNCTTNNITGVIDTDNYFYTASLFESYYSNISDKVAKLAENINTKYVENFQSTDNTIENTKGKAIAETSRWLGETTSNNITGPYPIFTRIRMFGYNGSDGGTSSITTYRPVIWN